MNLNPIPAEVITNIAQGTISDQQVLTTDTKVSAEKPPMATIKPSQQEVENRTIKVATTEVAMSMANKTTARPSGADEGGFLTPIRKHILSSAVSVKTMEGIEMSNTYNSLNLQSWGTTCGQHLPPGKDLSPSKQMRKKLKKNEAFMSSLDRMLAREVEQSLAPEQPGKVDASVTLLGRVANDIRATTSLTGYGIDEEIQDNLVTGEATWQNGWGKADSDEE